MASKAISTARRLRLLPIASARKSASELCTVVDDGTIPSRRGSINIDDEGTPTHRTVLIENGILKGYLQDKLNAGSDEDAAHRQRPARELCAYSDAAHDQYVSCSPANRRPKISSAR